MRLRLAMLLAVPIVGILSYLTYFRLTPTQDAGRAASTLSVLPTAPVAPAETRAAANPDAMTVLQGEIASLRAEVTNLRQKQMIGQSASSGTQSEQADADDHSRALARAEAARNRQARMAEIDAAFRKQITDPTWSASTSATIQSVLNSDDVGHIQADSIECRSQTCRVELHDDGTGQLNKTMPILALQLAGTLPSVAANTVTQTNGGSTVTLYLSRHR